MSDDWEVKSKDMDGGGFLASIFTAGTSGPWYEYTVVHKDTGEERTVIAEDEEELGRRIADGEFESSSWAGETEADDVEEEYEADDSDLDYGLYSEWDEEEVFEAAGSGGSRSAAAAAGVSSVATLGSVVEDGEADSEDASEQEKNRKWLLVAILVALVGFLLVLSWEGKPRQRIAAEWQGAASYGRRPIPVTGRLRPGAKLTLSEDYRLKVEGREATEQLLYFGKERPMTAEMSAASPTGRFIFVALCNPYCDDLRLVDVEKAVVIPIALRLEYQVECLVWSADEGTALVANGHASWWSLMVADLRQGSALDLASELGGGNLHSVDCATISLTADGTVLRAQVWLEESAKRTVEVKIEPSIPQSNEDPVRSSAWRG